MDTFLHRKFRINLISSIKTDTLLIAISGGQDSICLLQLIYDCLHKTHNRIEAIYIDHQWENNNVLRIKHLINIMQKTMIRFSIYQIKQKTFSESEARKLRYQALLKHALKYKYDTIITGHNYNDQVETILQNLLRGTSISSISNIIKVRKFNNLISINKPLINFTKTEIAWLCRHSFLPIWSDITNYDHNINRNRLRHELLPYLKNHFNPKIDYQLHTLSNLHQDDNEYIKEITIKLYLKSQHKYFVALNMDFISKQHISLQKRVLQLHFHYNFNKIIKNKNINKVIESKKEKLHLEQLSFQHVNEWFYTSYQSFTIKDKNKSKK